MLFTKEIVKDGIVYRTLRTSEGFLKCLLFEMKENRLYYKYLYHNLNQLYIVTFLPQLKVHLNWKINNLLALLNLFTCFVFVYYVAKYSLSFSYHCSVLFLCIMLLTFGCLFHNHIVCFCCVLICRLLSVGFCCSFHFRSLYYLSYTNALDILFRT